MQRAERVAVGFSVVLDGVTEVLARAREQPLAENHVVRQPPQFHGIGRNTVPPKA